MYQASLVAQMVKSLPAMQETWIPSLGQEGPLEKEMATHSSILTWKKSHGWRSLAGYTPLGGKESDMTEQLTHICTRHCATDMHPSTSPQLIISLSNVSQCLINCSGLCYGILGP